MGFSAGISVRRLTSRPEPRSVTVAGGTSLCPAGPGLAAVLGPDAGVAVAGAVVVGAAAWVVPVVAVRGGIAAPDLVGVGLREVVVAGRVAVVIDASSVVVVDEPVGAGLAVEDVVESAPGGAAARSSRPPPPLHADAA